MIDYKNILFCTDFSEDAGIAFVHALDLAKKYDARLHILHVPHSGYLFARHIVNEHVPEGAPEGEAFFNNDLAKRAEEALKETYEKRIGDLKNCLFVIKVGTPPVEIIRYARKNDVDLIVMGALGRHEADRIEQGSTVANVSRYAHCHVIAIRNPAKLYTLPGIVY